MHVVIGHNINNVVMYTMVSAYACILHYISVSFILITLASYPGGQWQHRARSLQHWELTDPCMLSPKLIPYYHAVGIDFLFVYLLSVRSIIL